MKTNLTRKKVSLSVVAVLLVFLLTVICLFQVILHDAVRPFVDEQTLQRVTLAAKKHGVSGILHFCVESIQFRPWLDELIGCLY